MGENINSADVIHEITKQIMMKLDKSNKKKQIIEKQSLLKLTKNIKELDFDFGQIEKSTQVLYFPLFYFKFLYSID